MTDRYTQLADGTVPEVDSLEAMFENMEDNRRFDMSSIFPGPGTYAVTVDDIFGYVNPKSKAPSARAVLLIDRVEGQPKSGLVGRSFSTFFSMSEVPHPETKVPPITFTARRLCRILTGEHADGFGDTEMVKAWMRTMRKGQSFIVMRTVGPDKNGVTRANDIELSFEEYKSKYGSTPSTPEEKPEVAADAGNL